MSDKPASSLPDEDDFTHYFKATQRLSEENAELRTQLAASQQEIETLKLNLDKQTQEVVRTVTQTADCVQALAESQRQVAELRDNLNALENLRELRRSYPRGVFQRLRSLLVEDLRAQLQTSSQSVWEQAIAIIGSTFQGSSCRTVDVIAALQAARDAQKENP